MDKVAKGKKYHYLKPLSLVTILAAMNCVRNTLNLTLYNFNTIQDITLDILHTGIEVD